MFAVIFTAEINQLDDLYSKTAIRLRDLAISEYGCTKFTSCTEGDREIAISYWQSKEQIQAWKNDPIHRQAQQHGRANWYKSYSVEIVEILHQYTN